MATPQLIVIHLARKPTSGTVTGNVLKHGVGGLNINACRIGTGGESLLRTQNQQDNGGSMNPGVWQGGTTGSTLGRWPANLILRHEPGCRKVGERYELLNNQSDFDTTEESSDLFSWLESESAGQMVEVWECVAGCPCPDMDQQSDSGDVSRYFKQVQSEQELVGYLQRLLSSPEGFAVDVWSEWPTEIGTLYGLVLCGFVPTEEQMDIINQAMVPGSHLCLIAPETQPTGHVGAIRLEDAGFEIRDAILLVQGASRTHYVAKAPRKEREAGCAHLPAKKGFEAVERVEGSAGVKNPRAGAGRTAGKVHNFHPTVKPIALMVGLLKDVPKDLGPVLDSFVGSGTTMMACLETGHSGLGIERDPEYMKIVEARVRYGNRWTGATIIQDKNSKTEEPPAQDLFDLLG